jgi:hypothetical protein
MNRRLVSFFLSAASQLSERMEKKWYEKGRCWHPPFSDLETVLFGGSLN